MKKTKKTFLFCSPKLDEIGGIQSYCRAIKPFFSSSVIYHEQTTRSVSSIRRIVAQIGRYIYFLKQLKIHKPSLVIFNPSLRPMPYIRDMIYIIFTRQASIPFLVFFHGFNLQFCYLLSYFPFLFRPFYGKAKAIIALASIHVEKIKKLGYEGNIYQEYTVFEYPTNPNLNIPYFSTPQNPLHILYMGRLIAGKRCMDILKIYKQLRDIETPCQLGIAGIGPMETKMKKYVENYHIPDVVFHGFIRGKEKEELFLKSSFFIFPPSHSEGLPVVIIEAMYYGLVVVTNGIGGINDFFEQGKMGYVIEKTHIHAYVTQIKKLINDPQKCAEISIYNQQFSRKHFDPYRAAMRLEKLYNSITLKS